MIVRALRAAVVRAGAILALGLAMAPPVGADTLPSDMTLGDPQAKIVVIEYASVGCPHCAAWANDVFPEFRKKYIDSGQVRFVFRELLTGNTELAGAGFLMARCASPDRYFQVVDDIFASTDTLARDGLDALAKIGERAGLTHERVLACIQDQDALAALWKRAMDIARDEKVNSTPTFVIGDQKLEGEQSLDELDAAIARVGK